MAAFNVTLATELCIAIVIFSLMCSPYFSALLVIHLTMPAAPKAAPTASTQAGCH